MFEAGRKAEKGMARRVGLSTTAVAIGAGLTVCLADHRLNRGKKQDGPQSPGRRKRHPVRRRQPSLAGPQVPRQLLPTEPPCDNLLAAGPRRLRWRRSPVIVLVQHECRRIAICMFHVDAGSPIKHPRPRFAVSEGWFEPLSRLFISGRHHDRADLANRRRSPSSYRSCL